MHITHHKAIIYETLESFLQYLHRWPRPDF